MSAPRIPNDVNYWLKKGKVGKDVMLYTHDDMDGIFSAIVMKGYLESKGFRIVGYGLVNYQEGWRAIRLNKKYINVSVDFGTYNEDLDIYIDHHDGSLPQPEFIKPSIKLPNKQKWCEQKAYFIWQETQNQNGTENWLKAEAEYKNLKEKYQKEIKEIKELNSKRKKYYASKIHLDSAYEVVCKHLGIPLDKISHSIISMIDAAKYDYYNIDIKRVIDFNLDNIKNTLEFSASLNQLIKRGEHKTIIEVIANCKGMYPSIYHIFRCFKILFPANNLNPKELKRLADSYGFVKDNGEYELDKTTNYLKKNNRYKLLELEKDFLEDGYYRVSSMEKRIRGKFNTDGHKRYINSQNEFISKFSTLGKSGVNEKISLPGYQIIGQLMFVPSGTWANPPRARAILDQDLERYNIVPPIHYRIPENCPLFSELKKNNGKQRELVGDIMKVNKSQILNVRGDVTNDKEVLGIKGQLYLKDENTLYFIAKQPLFFIMLQYGNMLQVVSINKMDDYVKEYLPRTNNGIVIDDLGKYCEILLENFKKTFNYNTKLVPDFETDAGGHKGIGNISNIFGEYKPWMVTNQNTLKYVGCKFIDLFKNQMIKDLSRVEWKNIGLAWSDIDADKEPKVYEKDINKRVMWFNKVRKIDNVEREYRRLRNKKAIKNTIEEKELIHRN